MYWEKAMRHKKPRFIICTYKDFTLSRNEEQRPLASFTHRNIDAFFFFFVYFFIFIGYGVCVF